MSDNTSATRPEPGELSFDCLCCGHCCKGRGGIVVSFKDLKRLCGHLRMTGDEFESTWGERHGNKLHIRAGADGACAFFKNGAGCAVHVAKPDICRAWPYFRGNLLDADSLELSKAFCPGIPSALPHADFARQGLDLLVRENLAGSAGDDEANALQITDLLESLAENDKKR